MDGQYLPDDIDIDSLASSEPPEYVPQMFSEGGEVEEEDIEYYAKGGEASFDQSVESMNQFLLADEADTAYAPMYPSEPKASERSTKTAKLMLKQLSTKGGGGKSKRSKEMSLETGDLSPAIPELGAPQTEQEKLTQIATARSQYDALEQAYKLKAQAAQRAGKGLMRPTFNTAAFDQPTLEKAGPLMARTFQLGGLVSKALKSGAKKGASSADSLVPSSARSLFPEQEPSLFPSIIKEEGGNWMTGAKGPEEFVRPLYKSESLDNPTNAKSLNMWIKKKLTPYIKNKMGTPSDPVRIQAEKEGILPFPDTPVNAEVTSNANRIAAGLPIEQQAPISKTDRGQAWENRADAAINVGPYQDMVPFGYSKDLNETLKDFGGEFAVQNPTAKVSGMNTGRGPEDLGFNHIIDVLQEDLTTGRLSPDSLRGLSMEDAVRRTYEYDLDMADKMKKAQIQSLEGVPVHKAYPEQGFRWMQLDKPGYFAAESDAMGHSVRGYEPPVGHPDWTPQSGNKGSLGYGRYGGWEAIKSGDVKVYSLADDQGKRYTTVEAVKTKHPLGFTYNNFTRARAGNDFPTELRQDFSHDGYLEKFGSKKIPEEKLQEIYDLGKKLYFENPNAFAENRLLSGAPAPSPMDSFQKAADQVVGELPLDISQIKGQVNGRTTEEALPFVQDFLNSGKWSDVNDLHLTGLQDITNTPALENYLKNNQLDNRRFLTEAEYNKYETDFLRGELTNQLGGFDPLLPQGMARGGMVQYMAAGGLPFAPTAMVRPSAREELDKIKAEYVAYEPKVAEYNTALEKYKTDVYNPYQTQAEAYNAALEKYKAEQFNPYQAQVDAYNAALEKYKTDVYAPYETQVDSYNTALGKYKTDVYDPYEAAQKKYDAEYAAVFATPKPVSYAMSREFQNLVARKPVAPAEFSMAAPTAPAEFSMAAPTAPAQFGGVAPTAPAEFAQKAPTAPTVSPEDYKTKMAAAKTDTANRQLALNVAMDPESYGLSMPKLFARGGVVQNFDGGGMAVPYPDESSSYSDEPAQFIKDAKRDYARLKASSTAREQLAKIAALQISQGGPDLAGLGVEYVIDPLKSATLDKVFTKPKFRSVLDKPANPRSPRIADQPQREPMIGSLSDALKTADGNFIGSSEDVIKRAQDAKLMGPSRFSPLIEGGASLGLGLGAAAAKPTAKFLGKEAARQVERGIFNEGPLRGITPQPMYAVRPEGGGTSFTNVQSSGKSNASISKLDKMIDAGANPGIAGLSNEMGDAIENFWRSKGQNYFTRQYGTPSDPIFNQIMSGQLRTPALQKQIPDYAIEQTRTGKTRVDPVTGESRFYPKYPQALEDLTRRYDEMTGLKGLAFNTKEPLFDPSYPSTIGDRGRQLESQLTEDVTEKMVAGGMDPNLINPKLSLTGPRGDGSSDLLNYIPNEYKELYNLYKQPPEEPNMINRIYKELGLSDTKVPGVVPENIKRAIQTSEPIYDIDMPYKSALEELLAPKNINQYLATLSPKEITKMRFEDVVKNSARYNLDMFNTQNLVNAVKGGKRIPEKTWKQGLSEPLMNFEKEGQNFTWHRILDNEATAIEGAYIGHSVGGYAKGGAYGPKEYRRFKEGEVEVYTLRDSKGKPFTTVQVEKVYTGPLGKELSVRELASAKAEGRELGPLSTIVKQIKGNGAKTGNVAPKDADEGVLSFLKTYVKPDKISESDSYLTPKLEEFKMDLSGRPRP